MQQLLQKQRLFLTIPKMTTPANNTVPTDKDVPKPPQDASHSHICDYLPPLPTTLRQPNSQQEKIAKQFTNKKHVSFDNISTSRFLKGFQKTGSTSIIWSSLPDSKESPHLTNPEMSPKTRPEARLTCKFYRPLLLEKPSCASILDRSDLQQK